MIMLSMILFVQGALAAPIDGAFGYRLGERLDLDSPSVQKVTGIVNEVYRVTPPTPLDGFDEYLVFITPLTQRIFRIQAFAQYDDLEYAHRDYKYLRDILSEKYQEDIVNKGKSKSTKESVTEHRKESVFESDGDSVNISIVEGRAFEPASRPGDHLVYFPRIVITYYSFEEDLTDEENEKIERLRDRNDGERYRRKRNARSIL
jgi:hypothetical protein